MASNPADSPPPYSQYPIPISEQLPSSVPGWVSTSLPEQHPTSFPNPSSSDGKLPLYAHEQCPAHAPGQLSRFAPGQNPTPINVYVGDPALITQPRPQIMRNSMGNPVNVPDYLPLAICSVFFCTCLGIGAIISSVETRNAKTQGKFEEARNRSKTALHLSISGIIVGMIFTIVYIVVRVAAINAYEYRK